jgi:tight adherence protein C
MPITIYIAAAALAASVPLAIVSWRTSRPRTGDVAAASAAGGPVDLRRIDLQRSPIERVLRPLLAGLGKRARRFTPLGWIDSLERRLQLAGASESWPVERVLAIKVLVTLAGLGAGFAAVQSGASPTMLLAAGITTVSGYFIPDMVIGSLAKDRQKQIEHELADSLDQITISVEAGLGFEAALARAASTGRGPLAQELMRALQEMQLGASRHQALRNLSERTDVPDLRTFIFAVIQAESYGLPIAHVLRVQSGELRDKRRVRAEERALKVPVKIIFPLVMCIFPSLFIVLLGPAAIRIWRALA